MPRIQVDEHRRLARYRDLDQASPSPSGAPAARNIAYVRPDGSLVWLVLLGSALLGIGIFRRTRRKSTA